MRSSVARLLGLGLGLAPVAAACAADNAAATGSPTDSGVAFGDPRSDAAAADTSVGATLGADAAPVDAALVEDAFGGVQNDAGGTSGPPSMRVIGRFDTRDPAGMRIAWPGTALIARFDGTGASATLSQMDGYAGGPSYFDVIVDGVVAAAPLIVAGTSQSFTVASGLAPGAHTVTLEKRTEANLGTVRFEGFTFSGGAGLLAPPAPASHRLEVMGDSSLEGYGILGNRTVCGATDPPNTNDSHQSFAAVTARGVGADLMLTAYSGKGLTVDESPGDPDTFPIIYPRAMPEDASSTWSFDTNEDAVIMSFGGVDLDGLTAAPAGFQAAYDALVGTVRAHYPNAYVWLLLWSQIKDEPVAERSALNGVITGIVSARAAAGDARLFTYVLPEANADTDETGCEGHANAAHEQAMATLMIQEIKTRTGW